MSYKGSSKKPNFKPYGNKKSGSQSKGLFESTFGDPFKSISSGGSGKSKKFGSNKEHNTKGKNNHGRTNW